MRLSISLSLVLLAAALPACGGPARGRHCRLQREELRQGGGAAAAARGEGQQRPGPGEDRPHVPSRQGSAQGRRQGGRMVSRKPRRRATRRQRRGWARCTGSATACRAIRCRPPNGMRSAPRRAIRSRRSGSATCRCKAAARRSISRRRPAGSTSRPSRATPRPCWRSALCSNSARASPKDVVQAYKWYALASVDDGEYEQDVFDRAGRSRDELAKKITRAEVEEGEREARKWKPVKRSGT